MKHIVSKYDKDTIYGIAQQYVSIQRDGEVMRIPFRQIPTVMKVFREEIQAELMEIYDEKYPIVSCAICGKPFRKGKIRNYCSDECRNEGNKRNNHRYWEESKQKKEVKCGVCGKTFTPPTTRYKYCSDECRKIAAANQTRISQGRKQKPKKDPLILSRINQEARDKGLTYGQLQAQKYMERMRKGEQHD